MIIKNKSIVKKNKLALAFILYNEGKTIVKAIEAFHDNGIPVYDYLVIGIDSTTKDNTYEQVRKYCPSSNIIQFTFNDDFSEARNNILKAIEHIDADFVIMPDGHEYLMPDSLQVIKHHLNNIDDNIHLINCMIGMSSGIDKEPEVIFQRSMFFRNKKNIRFIGKVHNYIDIAQEYKVVAPDIRFIHSMPEDRLGDRVVQRKQMNITELKKNADAGNLRDLFYLGNTYSDLQMYGEAIVIYEKCLKLNYGHKMMCQITINLASIYLYIKCDYDSVITFANKGLQCNIDRAELYCLLALAIALKVRIKIKSRKIHDELLEQAKTYFIDATKLSVPTISYFLETKYYTWVPWEGLMTIYSELGEFDKALDAANQVLKYKNDVAAKNNSIELEKYVVKNRVLSEA